MYIFLIPGAILAGVGIYIFFKSAQSTNAQPAFGGTDNVPSEETTVPKAGPFTSLFSAIQSDLGGSIPSGVGKWRTLAEKYAEVYANLDPEEILAIIWSESTGNPEAYNPGDPSWGLMGVTALIARSYAGFTDLAWHTDPDKNMRAGAGFLSFLKAKYEDVHPLSGPGATWVAAYNEGETKMLRGEVDPGYSSAFISHLSVLKRFYKV